MLQCCNVLSRFPLQAGGRQRPTALVLDFFVDGQIHAVQPDEDDSLRGPGGRRKQKHRVEVCNEKFPERSSKRGAWFLLDGHHKVEAAAQLGCSLNFLIISPCAEPYTPLEATDEFGSPLTRRATFPLLWPAGVEEDLCIRRGKTAGFASNLKGNQAMYRLNDIECMKKMTTSPNFIQIHPTSSNIKFPMTS